MKVYNRKIIILQSHSNLRTSKREKEKVKITKTFLALLILLMVASAFSWKAANCASYDVNGDGEVNILDIIQWSNAFGTASGDPGFDAAADVNEDAVIDVFDAVAISLHYGEVLI